MAINYTQSFNAGEVSRKMDGRNDLEIYKSGCRDLDNFFVLPQGGVERRAGTKFVQLAGSDGSNPARMIEFDFSSDVFYVIELGTDYAKVHYTSGGIDYVVDVTETDNINYTQAELRTVQFNRRYDTLILTCPTKETKVLKRTTITPTFTIEDISYAYPPLMEKNITNTTITVADGGIGETGVDVTATKPIFYNNSVDGSHIGSHWAIDHIRAASEKEVVQTSLNTAGTEIDVSFSNWSFETSGSWNAEVTIQRSIDGGTFDNYIVIGDTSSGGSVVRRNFKASSQVPEGKNTKLRVNVTVGTLDGYTLEADNNYHKGVIKIASVAGSGTVISSAALATNVVTIDTATAHGLSTGDYVLISGLGYTTTNPDIEAQITVTDADTFTYALTGADETFTTSSSSIIEASSRATADIVSMVQNDKGTVDSTLHWAESAFSGYRGFSPASEFFENRLWMAGSKDQPADLFGSVFGEIYNFLSGTLSTDAIKRTIDSPEEPKWLEGKRYLFLGTAGTAVSIRSADADALITQNNITTLVENAYGSAALQAEIANDVVVYVQRDGLKVRELVFDQGQDTFIGNDLNLISEDITDSGIVEMFVQKEPNQYIWCIKENGDACVMTYERGQDVKGWARINTDGEFFSGAAIHDSGEDVVWTCVKRTFPANAWTANTAYLTGDFVNYEGTVYKANSGFTSSSSFNASNWTSDTGIRYCIEKFHLRKDLDWYVDSGAEFDSITKSGNALNDISDDFLKINITAHGFEEDDIVQITSSTYSRLENINYKVNRIDADNFFLKIIGTSKKVPVQEFAVSGTTRVDGNYLLDRGLGDLNDPQTRYTKEGTTPGGYGFIGFTPSERYISLRWLITQPTDPEASDDFAGAGVDFVWDVSWGAGSEMAGGSFADGASRAITIKKLVGNKVTGLDHIEGKTVQVLVDGNYIADKVVTGGEVSVDTFGDKVLAGLPYTSTLRPMPIEPNLVNKLSQSRVKAVSKMIVRFFKTKGAAVGEQGKQLTTYSVLDTQDSLGQALELKTGQQRFFTASDYEREKIVEVRQDLPYPMTVLSIATHINAEGA